MKHFALLFLGMAIGTFSPSKYTWIVCMILATIFMIIDLIFEIQERKEQIERDCK